jgi:4-hydroxy-2-oxoheptanedioate aldolase
MINSVEDAKAFASFMKYPPIGERSWGPAIPLTMTDMPAGDYLKQANRFSLALAMIETRAAIDALDGILSVDGIDGVFVGPSDTSIALSHGGHVDATHPDVSKTLDHVVARCKAHKKFACCFSPTPAVAGEWIKKGYDLLALGTDFMQVRVGARAMIEQVRK